MNLSDIDIKYLKLLVKEGAIVFVIAEIIYHLLKLIQLGAVWDLFVAAIVPGALILVLFHILWKYNKEKENMLGL